VTFEEAILAGLGLVIEEDRTVKPGFNHRSQCEIDEDNKCGRGHEAGAPHVEWSQPPLGPGERQGYTTQMQPRIASEFDGLTSEQLMARLRATLDKARVS